MSTNNYTTIRDFIISLFAAYRQRQLVPFPWSSCRRCGGWGHIYEKRGNVTYSLRCPVCNRKRTWLLFFTLACLLLSACKPGDYAVLVNHDKPEEVARAEVLKAQAEQIRTQTETDRQRELIQTEVISTTAKLNQSLAAERGRAEIQAQIEQSKAQTQVTQAIGISLSSVTYGIGAGLIISEVVAAVCFTAYILIALLVRLKQAPAKSRAVVVTGYVNNTRMDMIIFQDNDDSWHIIDPLEGSRGAINQSRGAQAMRMHLLSNFAQLALPAPAARAPQQPQQEGILFRAWHFLFNRKSAARKIEVVE